MYLRVRFLHKSHLVQGYLSPLYVINNYSRGHISDCFVRPRRFNSLRTGTTFSLVPSLTSNAIPSRSHEPSSSNISTNNPGRSIDMRACEPYSNFSDPSAPLGRGNQLHRPSAPHPCECKQPSTAHQQPGTLCFQSEFYILDIRYL